MSKFIDTDKLKERIDKKWKELADKNVKIGGGKWDAEISTYLSVLRLIDSLQQDDTQVDKMLCSQIWWEEQGWIMIPPDATIEGIDSLLKQVRKKLQQEQSEIDLEKEIEDYCGSYENRPVPDFIEAVAKHFYKLGLKTRKEE